jgi:hypothetical protein
MTCAASRRARIMSWTHKEKRPTKRLASPPDTRKPPETIGQ